MLFGVSGCGLFKQPLVTEEESAIDERLLGNWVTPLTQQSQGDSAEMAITIRSNMGRRSISIDCWSLEAGQREQMKFMAVMTEIGGRRFLCLSSDPPERTERTWDTYQYKVVAADEVRFFGLDDSMLEAEVRGGRLPGRYATIRPGLILALLGAKSRKELQEITATPAEMREFLMASPDRCFDMTKPVFVLSRPKTEGKAEGR